MKISDLKPADQAHLRTLLGNPSFSGRTTGWRSGWSTCARSSKRQYHAPASDPGEREKARRIWEALRDTDGVKALVAELEGAADGE